MEKYKICPNPSCGKHNKSSAIECAWCETDLSGVKPTDDATEAARSQTESNETDETGDQRPLPNSGNMIRLCESCGTKNAANARKCSSCGEDISDVVPTAEDSDAISEQESVKSRFTIISVDDNCSFEIPEGKTIIGREEGLKEYLSGKTYVSRKHAELDLTDGILAIRNLSGTNYTYVNNNRISDQNPVVIHDGDEIGLGGNVTNNERQEQAAYFHLKVD